MESSPDGWGNDKTGLQKQWTCQHAVIYVWWGLTRLHQNVWWQQRNCTKVWWHDKESDWWARGTSLLHGLEFLTAREIQGTVTRNSPCNSTRFFYCPVWLKLLPLTLLIFCCFLCVFFSSVYMALYLCSVLTNFWPKDIRVFKCEILLKMLNSGHCQKKKKRRNMIAILCLVNVFSELCLKDILRWNLYTGKRLIRSSPATFLWEAV